MLATGVALMIGVLELTPSAGMWVLWSSTPTVAAVIMLLVVTREGYSREGWKVLGLHRLGLSVWWIAFGLTLLVTVAASAVVWVTPLASLVVPEGGIELRPPLEIQCASECRVLGMGARSVRARSRRMNRLRQREPP